MVDTTTVCWYEVSQQMIIAEKNHGFPRSNGFNDLTRTSFTRSQHPPQAILSFLRQYSCIWSVRRSRPLWTSPPNECFPYMLTKLDVPGTTEAHAHTNNRLNSACACNYLW
jgi:hypothetical protein